MQYEIDLFKIIKHILHRIWIIILAFIIGAAGGFLYSSHFKTDTYTAKTSLILKAQTSEEITQAQINASESIVKTFIVILQSEDIIRNDIINTTGVPYSAGQIKGMTRMVQNAETYVLDITITAPTAEHAYTIAQAYAQYAAGTALEKLDGGYITTLTAPKMPTLPDSKGERRAAVLGGFLLAFLSAAVIAVAVILDTRIKDEDDLTAIADEIPIIGVIPSFVIASGSSQYASYGDRTQTKGEEK